MYLDTSGHPSYALNGLDALDVKSDGTCTWLSYFCNYFKAAGPNVIFRGCMNWSQISYHSHSRVTTGVVVYHFNYEQDPWTFDKQKVFRYVCCYFEQCISCFIIKKKLLWKVCFWFLPNKCHLVCWLKVAHGIVSCPHGLSSPPLILRNSQESLSPNDRGDAPKEARTRAPPKQCRRWEPGNCLHTSTAKNKQTHI